MKAIEVSQKVHLIRHWGKWYVVSRGAGRWELLSSVRNKKRTKEFDLDKTVDSLKKRS